MTRPTPASSPEGAPDLPPIPLLEGHWKAIVKEMGLSARQAEIVELVARGASLREVSVALEISISTIRTQQERIFDKTGTNTRGELLLRILALSHRVGWCTCRQKC